MKKLSLRTSLTILATILCLGTATAQEIKARFGTSNPESHPQTLGARKFAELVGQKSNGRIKISVYSAAQLGSDQQMQAALRGGTQEFTAPSTATLANLIKEFGVFGLPFAFDNEKHADAVLDGPFGKKLLSRLQERDLIGLAYWENGFRNFTNSRRPVSKVEDLSGLKVRTMQNNMYIDMFNELGANSVPLPVNELYTALDTKAVDAQENPFTVVYAQKFYDVQKYLSTTRHAYDVLVMIASKKFWDKLSADDQKLMQEAVQEAKVFQRKTSRELNIKAREELVKTGMQVTDISATERQRLREKLKPVTVKYQSIVGEETAKEFFEVLATTPY